MTISRADAIKAVLTYFIPRSHTGERGEHEEDFVRMIFNALPSADAVSREEYEEVKAYMDTLVDAFIEDGEELAESVKVVRCKDCCHAGECHKSVQYTRNEQNTVTIGYTPIEWCSYGEMSNGK